MKVLKKVFAFAIALTAIAMATSVMAADGDATYAFDGTNATMAATTGLTGDAQTTVAVVPKTFGADNAKADDIYYINQDTAANIAAALEAGVGLKGELNPVSGFQVRVGSNGSVLTYEVPSYVVDEDINSEEPVVEITNGVGTTYRYGFDGKITLNGTALNKILFTLSTNEEGVVNNTVTISTDDNDAEKINFVNNKIASMVGDVEFGLEISGVPAGVTVTLDSVVAE